MEPNEKLAVPSMGNNAIKHGLITGALLILFSLLTYALGMMQNKTLGIVTYILLVGGMFYGTKLYRDNYLNGFISYGKSFTSSFYIGLVASIILSVYIFFFYKFFDPEMIDMIQHEAEQEILRRNPEISDEELDMTLGMTSRFTTPVWMSVFGFLSNVLVSVIIALVISLFLKKEDPSQDQMV